ncbi:Fusaric acid resistance protein-like-domain-containing protein [Suillus bovinus]|uniref:Fusaric acid resistance protein-like-domain-containing protein n=1 Tax=Suillus bovinus TaxID=48563 RepID=UPI001B8640B2|nr:Fusaric acid resistance protein-like-domain-containing protein [Suillus bovinus]KAG2154411.1 Fusaric acid resistance protein-like-domain-containing protein [Suillus bovinus]
MSFQAHENNSQDDLPYLSFHSDAPAYGSAHFVGSPGQITLEEPNIPHLRPIPSYGSLPSSTLRPSRGRDRSVSYIVAHTPPLGVHIASGQNLRESLVRLSRVRTPPPEAQWSLFEQLMENEGQLSPRTRDRRHFMNSSHRSQRSSGLLTPEATSPGCDLFDDVIQSHSHEHNAREASLDQFNDHTDPTELEDHSEPFFDSPSPTSVPKTPSCYRFPPLRAPAIPILWKNILKCAVAYLIASLFTFSPYLSGFLSDISTPGAENSTPSPTGHMIATIAIYYNPAKTMGGMMEADSYCSIAFLYAAFVCLGSMSMFWSLEVRPGWEWLGDALVIFWVGVSMWGLTWIKVWMDKPTFNSACSMAAIILSVVIVKEGGLETLLQVFSVVLVGTLISNIVCFTLWPKSATGNLQLNMIKTLDSFATLLGMVTNTFLLEEPIRQLSQDKIHKAVESHQASFTGLKKNLEEAKSEWFSGLRGQEGKASRQAYEDAVDSLTRLAQHLNGLRSGTRLQYELTKAHSEGRLTLKRRDQTIGREPDPSGYHSPAGMGRRVSNGGLDMRDDTDEILLQAAADMFGDLVDDLGPPLKALTRTCTASFKRLREAFAQSKHVQRETPLRPHDFHLLIDEIDRALFTFESTSNHAVMRLYKRSNFSAPSLASSFDSLAQQDNTILMNNEYEHIFLLYFFIFTLQEFSRELISLTDAMRRIYAVKQIRADTPSWFHRYILHGPSNLLSAMRLRRRNLAREKSKPSGLRRLSSYFTSPHHAKVFFPKVQPHAPNTIQTPHPANLPFIGRMKRALWDFGGILKGRKMKYAFKVGMSAAVLAAPAFFDATRPIFTDYKGEWALISFFGVMSPTIGATNFLSIHRVLGTLFGAVAAAGIYSLFPENAIVLTIFGFFFSMPCFYYIIAIPEYATTGRFALLTYNLTCLYSYNVRQAEVSVIDIAFYRSTAVTVGALWAAIVSRFWWPSEARRELSRELGDFCLNIGWLYTHLVAANSGVPRVEDDTDEDEPETQSSDETTSLLPKSAKAKLSKSIHEFMAMELHLQRKLIELQDLLAQTQHEPRLKGPFPIALYRAMLTSLQTILDRLHSMRCVTTREEWITSVRRDFILPVNKERREMVGNIVLYFSTLASAFRLKAPLPPYLPPAEESRERLVNAIRKLNVVRNRDVKASRHLLFFAYALTMKGVTQELEYLGRTLQTVFGVIGHNPEEFEALFVEPGESVDVTHVV